MTCYDRSTHWALQAKSLFHRLYIVFRGHQTSKKKQKTKNKMSAIVCGKRRVIKVWPM